MSSRGASSLQSDATSADSLHVDVAAIRSALATGAGVQVQSQPLQDAHERCPCGGRRWDSRWMHSSGESCSCCETTLLFAARERGDGLCGPCSRVANGVPGPERALAPCPEESPAVRAADMGGDLRTAPPGDGESPSLSPARGRSQLLQAIDDVTNSVYRECQEKAPGAAWRVDDAALRVENDDEYEVVLSVDVPVISTTIDWPMRVDDVPEVDAPVPFVPAPAQDWSAQRRAAICDLEAAALPLCVSELEAVTRFCQLLRTSRTTAAALAAQLQEELAS